MFNKEDFELPMEKMLRLRVIEDEVDNCRDLDVLRTSLKETAKTLMRYQHLLSKTLEAQMKKELESFSEMAVKIVEDM